MAKATAANATAQPARTDPVRVDAKHYKIELENDRVRVLRIKYGAKEKSVMHSHPATVAIFLGDSQFASHLSGREDRRRQCKSRSGYVL